LVQSWYILIPETIVSVVVDYNLPQISDNELKLIGPVIAN